MQDSWRAAVCACLLAWTSLAGAQELNVRGPLHLLSSQELKTVLPSDTHLLLEPVWIERWLDLLDDNPPDWPTVYGHGHHDPGHDDRLFTLNRDRDAKRAGKPVLSWLITFAWFGELSGFNPEVGGFSVALGPKFISTRWGVVRFKADEMPGNLLVTADPQAQAALQREIDRQRLIEIDVLMTGRLIPDESLVYDFSHEEEGRGLIMPVVRVEEVRFVRRVGH